MAGSQPLTSPSGPVLRPRDLAADPPNGGRSDDPPSDPGYHDLPDAERRARRRKEIAQWLRRQRLERQLHDGAALRISALSLRLGLLRYQRLDDEDAWQDRIGELQDELHSVLQELREVANKIYPPLLDEAGLGPALRELADQRGVELATDTADDRFSPSVEGAAYFAIAECLASRPDNAGPVAITIRREGQGLVLGIQGLDCRHTGVMLDQAAPLGGTVDVDQTSTPGTGVITVRIPCE
jgi:signal transduction histidine kinase